MPREIDCPCTHGAYSPKTISGIKYCGNCKNGKIKAYTEAEMQEAINKLVTTLEEVNYLIGDNCKGVLNDKVRLAHKLIVKALVKP